MRVEPGTSSNASVIEIGTINIVKESQGFMGNSTHIITLSSYVVLAWFGMLMSTGCGSGGDEYVDSIALEIRFQDDASPQPSSAGLRRFASMPAGPTTHAAEPTAHDTVARILVDIGFSDSSQPFFTNVELTKLAPDVWRGDVSRLPRNQQLRFVARALGANSEVAFSGEILAPLTRDHQSLQIPLAPVQGQDPRQTLRIFRIVYPQEMFAGQEEQVAVTLQGNPGAAIDIQITALGSSTPAPEFSPATGTVTLTNTVADLMTVYTPPEVTTDTDFDYQVTITDHRAQRTGAVTTNFRTHIKPRTAGVFVRGTRPSVRFSPVILRLTANGSEVPGTVTLVAAVSGDSGHSAPAKLAFQWSYTPSAGTAAVTFANNGQGNPGLFEGYTVAHQGTITLAVTNEHNDTTTLHYQLLPGQFAGAIEHGPVSGLAVPRPATPTPACAQAKPACAPGGPISAGR